MINEEWKKTTKWCPFCRLLRHAWCHVCSARWNGRCVNHRTAVVYSYTPIKPHRVSQANWFPFQTLFTSRKKKKWDLEQELPSLLQSYKLRGKQPFIFDFSRLLPHAIEKAEVLFYIVQKRWYPTGIVGKGENAGKQHFLLFPQCFQTNQRQQSSFDG